ncbi:MAG: hypothetical protein K2Q15_16875 [Burkholderiales bacterium]|nr:hypothetical protein [Burkholderiales bacterium]
MLEDKDLKDGMALIKKMEAHLDQITKLMTPKSGNEAADLNVFDHHHHKWALNRIVQSLESIDKNIALGINNGLACSQNIINELDEDTKAINTNINRFFNEFQGAISIWLHRR